MFCRPEIRRPKAETRKKAEFREWPDSIGCCSAGVAPIRTSAFGFLSAFGLRVSGLEWPGPTLEQPCRMAYPASNFRGGIAPERRLQAAFRG